MRNIVITAIFIIFWNSASIAQGSDIHTVVNRMYAGVSMLPSLTTIDGTSNLDLSSESQFNIQANVDFGFYFTKSFGLGFGVGQSSFTSKFSLNEPYADNFQETDDEGDNRDVSVTIDDYEENLRMSYITVPVHLLLRLGKKIGFYLHPGAELSIGSSWSYEHSGIYTYHAYYPAYNVTFTDLENYGFVTDKPIDGEESINESSFAINGKVEGGVFYTIKRKFAISIGFHYKMNLMGLETDGNSDNFLLSDNINNHNSISDSFTDASLQGLGGHIGVRYYIK